MFGLTIDQISSFLRTLLKFAAGALVTKGVISPDVASIGIGIVMGLCGIGFSIIHHTLANATTADILGGTVDPKDIVGAKI